MNMIADKMIAELEATDQDYEFYPTTDEIIADFFRHANTFEISSLLDIGAGNGKVLNRFKEYKTAIERNYQTEYFAIEKARPLLDSLSAEIGILGTDFWEQSLLDKEIDCIFSNPPYAQFIEWSVKLIREANSNYIYLVIPQRWKDQKEIISALEARKAEYKVIGNFDFLAAEDRKARAQVDLIFINLGRSNTAQYRRPGRENSKVDPFELWVNDFFGLTENMSAQKVSEYTKERMAEDSRKERLKNALVSGNGLIESLFNLYQDELNNLISNYQKVCSLDPALFKELDISVSSVVNTLKVRIKGLKDAYWQELFDNYDPLTSRLTAVSREAFIRNIRRKSNIDFTPSNAYAITVWAVKNANTYFDTQLIETFNKMVEAGNIINYKSNQRVFKNNHYRYYETKPDNVKLDFRIVLEHIGGICTSSYSTNGSRNGLSGRAADFLDDLTVIAGNLGFLQLDGVKNHNFAAGKREIFTTRDKSGKDMVLMDVRAFLNGNLHIKFSQKFILALNCEVVRLMGWIHNVQQAAEELGEDVSELSEYFKSNFTLLPATAAQQLLTKMEE